MDPSAEAGAKADVWKSPQETVCSRLDTDLLMDVPRLLLVA